MTLSSELDHGQTSRSSGSGLIVTISSWLIVAWTCFIFLGSLPYKFSNHPDTQHIFSTIGEWMKGILGTSVGEIFTQYGAVAVGSVELLTSLLLLSPIFYWLLNRTDKTHITERYRAQVHTIGGVLASMVMFGAAFFHLFTPLGIAVLHEGESDGGSLFRAAVSILILGFVLAALNISKGFDKEPQ